MIACSWHSWRRTLALSTRPFACSMKAQVRSMSSRWLQCSDGWVTGCNLYPFIGLIYRNPIRTPTIFIYFLPSGFCSFRFYLTEFPVSDFSNFPDWFAAFEVHGLKMAKVTASNMTEPTAISKQWTIRVNHFWDLCRCFALWDFIERTDRSQANWGPVNPPGWFVALVLTCP